jgi:hypothetical protein
MRSRTFRKPITWLLLLIFGVSVMCSGGLMTGDAFDCYALANSIVRYHTIDTSTDHNIWPDQYRSSRVLGAVGIDGREVTRQEIGTSVYLLPWNMIGNLAGVPFREPMRSYIALFITTILAMPLAVAACVWFTYDSVRRLASERVGLTVGLALCFATPLCVFARDGLREPLLSALVACFLWDRVRMRDRQMSWIGAFALAGIIVVKSALVLVCIPLWLAAAWGAWQSGSASERKRVLLTAIAPCIAVAICLAYNYVRFGSFTPRYAIGESAIRYYHFTLHAVSRGFIGLWLTPSKSLFIYAPVALLAIPGLSALRRSNAALFRDVLVVTTGVTLVHAPLSFWHGDGCWGPRYIYPCLPALFLAIGAWLAASDNARRIRIFAALVAIGMLVQLPAMFLRGDVAFQIEKSRPNGPPYFSLSPSVQPVVMEYATAISVLREEAGRQPLPWSCLGRRVSLAPDAYFNTWSSHLLAVHVVKPRSTSFVLLTVLLIGMVIANVYAAWMLRRLWPDRAEAQEMKPALLAAR